MNAAACILYPLTVYILLAVGLGSGLYLFIALKAELRRLERRQAESQSRTAELATALDDVRRLLDGLENDLRDVERQTGMLVAPTPPRAGLNLSRRTQVLRMHRSGQENAAIAEALALPRAEVDLLIKVHRISVRAV